MNKDMRAGLGGAAAVTATYLIVGGLNIGWEPDLFLMAPAMFAVFFGLFYRDSKVGEMMSPLWLGIFGVAAASSFLVDWLEEVPTGVRLVVDVVFFAAVVFLAVHGWRRWIREEWRGHQRSGA